MSAPLSRMSHIQREQVSGTLFEWKKQDKFFTFFPLSFLFYFIAFSFDFHRDRDVRRAPRREQWRLSPVTNDFIVQRGLKDERNRLARCSVNKLT